MKMTDVHGKPMMVGKCGGGLSLFADDYAPRLDGDVLTLGEGLPVEQRLTGGIGPGDGLGLVGEIEEVVYLTTLGVGAGAEDDGELVLALHGGDAFSVGSTGDKFI